MARLWKTFVLVVALAVVACEALRQLRYEDIVDRAIEAYNSGQQGGPLFRLLSATPPSSQVSICPQSLQTRQCRFLLPGPWGCSSAGRVSALYARKPEFESQYSTDGCRRMESAGLVSAR